MVFSETLGVGRLTFVAVETGLKIQCFFKVALGDPEWHQKQKSMFGSVVKRSLWIRTE